MTLAQKIAATAARIIVEGELTDWQLARRKALAELRLPSRGVPLPTDEQIVRAITEHQRLFGGAEHEETLRQQRATALGLMHALRQFEPRLSGPVAEGWAHRGSEICIELRCASEKLIDYALIELRLRYDVTSRPGGTHRYRVLDMTWPISLLVFTSARERPPAGRTRLDIEALERLLGVR
ncbi:MAG: hypothetical protein NZ533_08875 [Casimicrobiaceae bacterium]|nr:hypothetical protein [Casimicrobiaceae bacterium]MDW8311904.1 hypothetical protein [Burkholderiales bacterium]